jgi:hypothetical protein
MAGRIAKRRELRKQKAADLSAKKGGVFFLQIVEEPMPEPEPAQTPPA